MTKVVSANRLADGIVVYVGATGAWVETIAAAAPLDTAEAVEAALVVGRADEAVNLIVDPFVVDVVRAGDELRALTLRDRIRAEGPTIQYGAPAPQGAA